MTILIPAYEPDIRLLELIIGLKERSEAKIVVIDDGSGEKYSSIFSSLEEFGCTLLSHPENKGKGKALKTGFEYIMSAGEQEGVVCADCDGQHLPDDIIKIAGEMKSKKDCIVLGSRHFVGKVPLRSRFGNAFTRQIYSLAAGTRIQDTQTGLRGYAVKLLPWLCSVSGERFEYEMNILLQARKSGVELYEMEIDTVYLQNNSSSHFRPLVDSARVYLPILKFAASSMLCSAVDFGLLLLLQHFTSNLAVAVAGSRLTSALCNYTLNRNYVFVSGDGGAERRSFYKYFSLVAVVLVFNYMFMAFFYQLMEWPLILAKIMTETLLFLFSYWAQKRVVFN